jgi:hypothetical protein
VIALRVTRRPGATEADETALALPPEGLTIGRSGDCGMVLADPLRLVSREHAQVIPVGDAVHVRCVSSRAPMWVNDVLLDPGCHRALFVGDRLRMGRFELAVEPAAAMAAERPRLERWFDLDGAPDPLAAGSPLPALVPASEAAALRTVLSRRPMASCDSTAPSQPRARAVPLPPARLPVTRPPLNWMGRIGALLRAALDRKGTLLPGRVAPAPRVGSDETRIVPRPNQPVKLAPQANDPSTRMRRPEADPGFAWRRHCSQQTQWVA